MPDSSPPSSPPSSPSRLSHTIIGAAIETHRVLGPGLLESAYEDILAIERMDRGLSIERQKTVPFTHKGHELDFGYRMDFLAEGRVVVETKAVDHLMPIHDAQVLTYLRLMNLRLGLLLNFDTVLLKDGLRRVVNGFCGELE